MFCLHKVWDGASLIEISSQDCYTQQMSPEECGAARYSIAALAVTGPHGFWEVCALMCCELFMRQQFAHASLYGAQLFAASPTTLYLLQSASILTPRALLCFLKFRNESMSFTHVDWTAHSHPWLLFIVAPSILLQEIPLAFDTTTQDFAVRMPCAGCFAVICAHICCL
jgi:hypothetical protein